MRFQMRFVIELYVIVLDVKVLILKHCLNVHKKKEAFPDAFCDRNYAFSIKQFSQRIKKRIVE